MKTLCMVLLLAVLSPSFAEETKAAKINVDALCQQWTHSREEEQPGDGVQIYRPTAAKKFPPSRFRMQYEFAKDGSCKWMFLAPTDGHHFKDGKWKLAPSEAAVLQIVKGEAKESYQVIELTKDLLKLKPLNVAE